jgi:MerR family transcriptional regulator, copper efflux regulator
MAWSVRISEVARTTGVPAKTIRYYEEVGVLPAANRTVSGYRQYDEAAVQRVRFIRRARALGLPLRHLKPLIGALNGRPRPTVRPRLLALVRHELSAVKERISELQSLQRELERVLQRPVPAADERRAICRCLEVEMRAQHDS